jgi:hypothetical protein
LYDSFFSLEGEDIFRRVTTDGLNRKEMLEYLQDLEFTVPLYGYVKDLPLKPTDEIVVYHDINAHRGEGKERCKVADASREAFATQFIPFNVPGVPSEIQGLSWRYLQVGIESFWIEYTSTTDWRSNCGEGDTQVLLRDKTELFSDRQYNELLIFKYPLFAVDFIPAWDKLYAIDFNIAPQIARPVYDLTSPKDIAEAISSAYYQLKGEIL